MKPSLPNRYWPIALKWRWRERDYAWRYKQWTHRCIGADGSPGAGCVLHLWALKIVFG